METIKRRVAALTTRKKVDSTIRPGDVIVWSADHRPWTVEFVIMLVVTIRCGDQECLITLDDLHCSGAWYASRAESDGETP